MSTSRLPFGIALLAALCLASWPGVAIAQPPSTSPSTHVEPVVLEPIMEQAYGIRSVAPLGWSSVSPGIRARGAFSSDPTLLGLQAAPQPPVPGGSHGRDQ